jgi:hypothetical protein
MGNYPVGGSGINMSANLKSISVYLDLDNYPDGSSTIPAADGNGTATPDASSGSNQTTSNDTVSSSMWKPNYGTDGYVNLSSSQWRDMVLTNPYYA